MIEAAIDAKGRQWKPFDLVWDGPDGQFCATIHAISEDHARLMLADIKATGRIEGEIIKEIPA